jgi:hypothetical protein
VSTQAIGKPGASQTLNGVKTDEYAIDILNNLVPVYNFNASIAGTTFPFEAVSSTSSGQSYIYESTPAPNGRFNILYRNDNQGNESNNTGYFLYFKQGDLKTLDFTINDSLPNRVVSINFDNINNSDVWLYALNSSGSPSDLWAQVPAVNGINVIYNNRTDRNLYSVSTRANDQIDLVFGDGSFTNIPVGQFRLYYRQSNNLSYKITPDEIANVPITIAYRGRTGRAETLTLRTSLKYTIANASARESLESIRTKAPQQYYTQNRMITGEDYNILPYTSFNEIIKAKAVNRASSGISRYLDVIDATGKYSSTNIFGQDGIIYKENYNDTLNFQFTSSTEVNYIIQNLVKPLIKSITTRHLYYNTATRFVIEGSVIPVTSVVAGSAYKIVTKGATDFTTLGSESNEVDTEFVATTDGTASAGGGTVKRLGVWNLKNSDNGRSSGTFNSPNYTYLSQGALIRFVAPTGKYFDAQNRLQLGTVSTEYQKTDFWTSVVSYNDPGLSSTATLSVYVPTGAIIDVVIPVFPIDWATSLTDTIKNNILSYKTFGLRYDLTTQLWTLIDEPNISSGEFSLDYAGDTSNTGLDASWFLKFSYNNQSYTVISRGLNYLFQSVRETRFYFDPDIKVYDSKTATTKKDNIKVLRSNTQPDSADALYYSKTFRIWNRVVGVDGYEDNRKILVTFPDENLDTVPDDPDLFDDVVNPMVNIQNKFVYFQNVIDQYQFSRYDPIEQSSVVASYPTSNDILTYLNLYATGTIFYATDEDTFYISTGTGITSTSNYQAKTGRQSILFQYTHNAPNNRRIDPSPNNIIDLYLLTKTYSDDYFAYIQDTSNKLTEPAAPTNEELKIQFGSIENYKSISDSIIYNTATFKPLFGAKAESALRATFKVVKNPSVNITDNDVKSKVIAAINDYFDINNWDFGESFYFSELSTYLHNALVPYVSSIIIVPTTSSSNFGTLFQINSEPNEIIVSTATVDNVQIISAITAGQINQ